MEEKNECREDFKQSKESQKYQRAIGWINRTGLIVECNDYFCHLVNSTSDKLVKKVYITDLTKFDNPNLLLEAVHELDELFGSKVGEGKSSWKALLANVNASIATEDEYFVVIHKPSHPDDVRRINNQIVFEATITPASELLPSAHRTSVRKLSSSDIAALEASKGPRKVLVVDDSPTALKMMGHLVKRLGHEVVLASDGLEALDMLRTQVFDIVLMDIRMPKMNGLEASNEFRKIEEERNRLYGLKNPSYLKVIALSGDVTDTIYQEVISAGFDAFIPKPLTQERFLEVLNMKVGGDQRK